MELLERESENSQLRDFLHEVNDFPRKRLLILEGPAGIGKTRLLQEAQVMGGSSGCVLLSARCSELEQGFVYGVVRQLLEPALAATGEAERAAILAGPASAASALFLPGVSNPPDQGADAASFATLHGLYWVLVNLTARSQILVTIDDLQWCDAPSLRWLLYLLPRLEGLSVKLILTLRPENVDPSDLLITQIITDQLSEIILPAPLSEKATAQLLKQELAEEVEEEFSAACHTETGGNPLLLRQLINTLVSERVNPTQSNVPRLRYLGASAVARMVVLRMSRLSSDSVSLAQAAAILGDGSELRHCADLADLSYTAASRAASELAKAQILHPTEPMHFVHPVVRAAIYAELTLEGQHQGHEQAARLLTEAGAEPERIAAHLLRLPPVGEGWSADVLRSAATQALARGAADTAADYLHRCLLEPIDNSKRRDVLIEAGAASRQVDFSRAAPYLQEALSLTVDPRQRAQVAHMLGQVLLFLMRGREAVDILEAAAEALPPEEIDLRRRLEAGIAQAPLTDLDLQHLAGRYPHLQQLKPHDGVGGRSLDSVLALHEMLTCDPRAIQRSRRGIADGVLVQQANGEIPLLTACLVLVGSDDIDLAISSLDEAVRLAQLNGSLTALAHVYAWRGLVWNACGQLDEAESDTRESLQLMNLTRVHIFQPFAASQLGESLIDQGRLDEAQKVLDAAHPSGPVPNSGAYGWLLKTRARLLRLQEQPQQALASAIASGHRFAPHGPNTSPLVAWRSEAALCLHALDRGTEALHYANEDLQWARKWGAKRSLGSALRVCGLVIGGGEGLKALREAVAVLKESPARLAYASALVDLGAELCHEGERQGARPPLRQALDVATRCGASPLAERARSQLAAAGGRPRHTALTGPDALTPSERRVAEMAAQGASNREIAQSLYVTPKTVEVHLSNSYRKLDITTRAELAQVLTAS
ncbi:helix-turn-helix transcriptional regulator [Streptomyces sp. NPDC053431]|uniref:helix-turn-helix transcriptional regulator n=1 Tax=Streptomyces sp. NPDC053431 TaxID=3365703 RepID=UPI0037D5FA20